MNPTWTNLFSGFFGAVVGGGITAVCTRWAIAETANTAARERTMQERARYLGALSGLSEEVIYNASQKEIGGDRKINTFSLSAWAVFGEYTGTLDAGTVKILRRAYLWANLHRQAVAIDNPMINRANEYIDYFNKATEQFTNAQHRMEQALVAAETVTTTAFPQNR